MLRKDASHVEGQTLARIEHELNRGHTYPALQRLASLAVAYPDDFDIRVRRAAVNRQIGNLGEAGRWGYLTEDVEPQDIAAFERAFPRPKPRLLALKLPDDPLPHLGPAAKARLHGLTAAAEQDGDVPAGFAPGPGNGWSDTLVTVGCGLTAIVAIFALFGLAGYGFLKLADII